jgi:hypothetical protein
VNTSFIRQILPAALGLCMLPLVLGAAPENRPAVLAPPTKAVITITVTPPPTIGFLPLATPSAAMGDADWANIKNYTYAQRTLLLAGLAGVQARVDAQIAELRVKRATMTPPTRTADWDFAMQEMLNARAYLRAMSWELAKATPETWTQQRERVGEAWVRTQNAYGRVRASTTT